MSDPQFTSAATLSIEALADLFTRSFAAYFYPGTTTPQALSRRVPAEQIDLFHSPVLLAGGEPAGLALLARRGERAWCGGFGIVEPQRGRGLAHALADALIRQARAAGARRLTLEVLTRNQVALRVYGRAGLQITRRLLVLSWRPGEADQPAAEALDPAEPADLVLGHFAGLHPAPPAWQREPAALLALPGLRGLALREGGALLAYAIVQGDAEGTRIYDLGARDGPAAGRLLAALQAGAASLLSINEPEGSPLTAAYLRAGFLVADEQHELELPL